MNNDPYVRRKTGTVTIAEKDLHDILYHLDSFLRLMGYGGEYNKIVKLVNSLPLENVDLSEFWNIRHVLVKKEK